MKKHYKLVTFLSLFVLAALSSCELYNPAEPVPAYIHIQKIDLAIADTTSTPVTGQGTKSSKISDAWVYIDDQLIGCFELPATFPVQYEGSHKLRVRAGIKVDGIATNRSPYPFYNSVDQTVDLQKGAITNVSVTTSYTSSSVFTFMSDFETTGTTLDTTHASMVPLQILYSATPSPNIFEGNYSAYAKIDNVNTFFECETGSMVLPTHGTPIFLEFNYKCNYAFTVSVLAHGTVSDVPFPALHFNPSNDWNKAYLYLTPTVSGASTAINYKIRWGMVNNTHEDSVSLFLDNIKLIHN